MKPSPKRRWIKDLINQSGARRTRSKVKSFAGLYPKSVIKDIVRYHHKGGSSLNVDLAHDMNSYHKR